MRTRTTRRFPRLFIICILSAIIAAGICLIAIPSLLASGANSIPASATTISINTGNRDAVIKSDGLYYYTESTDTYVRDTSYNGINPDGYVLSGTTTNTLTVEPGVTAKIYLDNVTMTSNRLYVATATDTNVSIHPSCINVSEANTTIILVGDNELTVNGHPNNPGNSNNFYACALEKSGMEGHLTMTTIDGKNESGSIKIVGTSTHEGALGSSMRMSDLGQGGFANLTIEAGVYTVQAGGHSPGIGANCNAYHYSILHETEPQYTKNIIIKKAIVTAYGGNDCAGIGGGYGVPVDGITISDGAKVTASGGRNSPGIGSGGVDSLPNAVSKDALNVSNIQVRGGQTEIIAYGDQSAEATESTSAIGCGSDKVSDANRATDATGAPVYYERKLSDVSATALTYGPGSENATGEESAWYGIVQCGSSSTQIDMEASKFVGEYSFADYLQSRAENDDPVSYVHIYFEEAPLVTITKTADTTGLSEANAAVVSSMLMAGAKYGVYTNATCTTPYVLNGSNLVITIGADGTGQTPIPPGTYYLKEIAAPAHFLVDTTEYPFTASAGQTNVPISVQDSPELLTVFFNDHDGTNLKTDQVPYGGTTTAPQVQNTAQLVFTGWDKPYNSITEDNYVVTAQYENKLYQVVFKVDGQTLQSTSELYGANVTPPTVPPVTGKHFSGWDSNAYTNVTSDLTILGTMDPDTFTVTFYDSDRTTVVKQETVEYGNDATAPTPLTHTGQNFTGWDKSYTNITSDLDVYAQYEDIYLDVIFKVDGNAISTQRVLYGSNVQDPGYTPPEGYTFSGWDKTFTNVTENLVINGTTTINQYTVTFKGEDGTVLKTETVNYGDDATAPTPPTITGKTFKEWDKSYTDIKQDTVVNAVYEDLAFTVKFVVNDQEIKSETVVYGHDATAPDPNTPEGYIFSGWDKGFTNVTKDLIVNGYNTINQYIVTFKGEDGSVIKTETVNYGGDATAPTPPSIEGKTFNRWDKSYTNIKQDTIVNAIYDDIVLNVKFVIDGVEVKSEQVQYGHNATPPTNTNTPEGYIFSGWDKSYTNVKTDLVINGTNNINQYTVIFKGENGTELKHETVNYGGDATAPTPPSITGKHFTSWDKGYTNIKQDTVVNAIYEENVYTVKFFIDNGLVKSEQVTHGRGATAPTNTNTLEGYTFSGWDKDFSNITSDLSVYGTNSPNKYTVVFKADDKEIKTETVAHGGAATAPEPPAIPGKKFTGWDKAYDKITGELVVTAIYEDIYLTVDFVINGKTVKSEQVLYGHAATAPEDLTIPTGCIVSGWDKPYDNVTENLTVKGEYIPIVYKVTFVMPDGSVIEIQEVNYGTDATAPQAPNINGKIFAGWDKEFTNVCSDLTVTAIYNDIPVVTPQSSDDAVQAIEATADFGLVTLLDTIASSIVASFALLLRRRKSIRK